MPAKDTYHEHVRTALEKDAQRITHDPLSVKMLGKTLQIDLGAERILAAEKGEQRIAVEIKSFIGASRMQDLKEALGPYMLYRPHSGAPRRRASFSWRCGMTCTTTSLSTRKANSCRRKMKFTCWSLARKERKSSNG